MKNSEKNQLHYDSRLIQKIFKNKSSFHLKLARLPIEEKIKILVELQKIVLNIRSHDKENDTRRVWEI